MAFIEKYKNLVNLLVSIKEVVKHGYPAKKLKVIGVTGTDGKTTTSHIIYEILKKGGYPAALLSTVAAYVQNSIIDLGLHVTTPDAKLLQPLLGRIVNKGTKYLVLETTSHGLDQHRTLGCNFWIGVLTNLTHEHLDYHKTFQKYKTSKAKLFKGIKIAVLNKDDKSFKYFESVLKRNTRVISYSINGKAVLSASKIQLGPKGMLFEIKEENKGYKITTSLLGKYNVSNLLAACGVARACDVNWEKIQKAIKGFKGVKGRMEIIDKDQNCTTRVDFAHTPNALESVLKTLKGMKKKNQRLIAIIGCAGERDFLKRPMMGEISAKIADLSIFTAEDPRHENVNVIIESMVGGAKKTGAKEMKFGSNSQTSYKRHVFIRMPDRRKAIKYALRKAAKEGDIVVICGKGHEKSMAFGDKEFPWSDQKVASQYLQK